MIETRAERVARLNRELQRDDVEWTVDRHGTYQLREREEWSRANAKRQDDAREAARQEWLRNFRAAESVPSEDLFETP